MLYVYGTFNHGLSMSLTGSINNYIFCTAFNKKTYIKNVFNDVYISEKDGQFYFSSNMFTFSPPTSILYDTVINRKILKNGKILGKFKIIDLDNYGYSFIHIKSQLYQDIVANNKKEHVTTKDLKPGFIYKNNHNKSMLFLGKYKTYSTNYYFDSKFNPYTLYNKNERVSISNILNSLITKRLNSFYLFYDIKNDNINEVNDENFKILNPSRFTGTRFYKFPHQKGEKADIDVDKWVRNIKNISFERAKSSFLEFTASDLHKYYNVLIFKNNMSAYNKFANIIMPGEPDKLFFDYHQMHLYL